MSPPSFVAGVSNPESMLVSEEELFKGREIERSMEAALYVQGLWVIGAVGNNETGSLSWWNYNASQSNVVKNG